MLSLFRAAMPKEDRFFDLFEAHARTLVDGAAALRRVLDGGEDVPQWCAKIMEHEHEADDVARDVLLAVRRSFITPFDRGDIRGLTNSLDDSIDQMQKTAKAILLFEVTEFAAQMRELGDLIVECAGLTTEAVALLPHMRRNVARLNELTEKLNQLESRSDDLYDAGMKALFKAQNGGGDAMAYIVGAEIYDHLEKVVDRFEDVANRINGILVEHL
jgi:predicted phosphate transport protein (TIGR00153 family)